MERLKHLGTQEYVDHTLVDVGDWITKGALMPVKNQRQCGRMCHLDHGFP